MKRKKKVVKFRQQRNINIGAVIFIFIFVYICANVFMFFTKNHLSSYEVSVGAATDEMLVHGVIIRNEELIYTDTAGYISYYQKEGERISKKSTLYSVDESKQVYEMLTNNSSFELGKNELAMIQKEVKKFQKKYADVDFETVSDFKYDIENIIAEVLYEKKMDNIQEMLKENGIVSGFKVVNSPYSGIVTYHYDNYETLKVKSVTADTFNQNNYKKTQLRTTDLISTEQPVCKIIKSQDWKIVGMISQEQYEKLQERQKIRVTLLKDNFTTTVPFSVYTSGGEYFIRLDFSKYMEKYLDERFVEVELHINDANGLKIPNTAIIEKDFYVIPNNMFNYGGDSKRKGITVLSYDTNGEAKATYVEPTIYHQDEDYSYVSVEAFERGTKIISTETQETYQLTTIGSLKGVYNVNNGYFLFRKVDVIYENDEYCIVKENVANSISIYDQIALDASMVIEEAMIY